MLAKQCIITVHVALLTLVATMRVLAQPPVPDGARVTVTIVGDANCVLGNPIRLRFVLSNAGSEPFGFNTGGDYRWSGFPTRYKCSVRDRAGTALAATSAATPGGMVGTRTLHVGGEHCEELLLQNYVRVDRPGEFTLRVVHDFGWSATDDKPHPVAEARFGIALPTAAQADELVRSIAAAGEVPDKFDAWAGRHSAFRHLCHPVFLEPLERYAAAGEVRAVFGLHQIHTAGATAALLRLMASDRLDVEHAAASYLIQRIPRRLVDAHSQRFVVGRLGGFWRPEAAERLLSSARRLLGSGNVNCVRTGCRIIDAIGSPADGETVLQALEAAISGYHPPREAPHENILDAPGPVGALRYALAALRGRGFRAPIGGGLGVIMAQFLELGDPNVARREDWEGTLAAFFSANPPVLREAAVRALPRPPKGRWAELLQKALNDCDRGVVAAACDVAGHSGDRAFAPSLANIVRAEMHPSVVRAAGEALMRLAAHWEATDAWIERLAHEHGFHDAITFLLDRLEHPQADSGQFECLPRDERIALRKVWRRFFADEERRAAVRAGKPIPVTLDQARRLLGGALALLMPDGSYWPGDR